MSFANDIQSDIDQLLVSFREYADEPSLDDAVKGVLSSLQNIYVGMDVRKYIYPQIIRQMVATSNESPAHYKAAYESGRSSEELRAQVKRLQAIPQAKQRSEEWHRQRLCTLGASETALLFGFGGFGTERALMRKKLGLVTDDYRPSVYTEHGVKYEPVIQQVYQAKEGLSVLHEFGSLIHPTRPYISASPDGITEAGRMLEIKAPYQREITGIPPGYYWTQMQQQMEVCDLDAVDYVECQISETPAELWLHQGTSAGLHRNRHGQYRGVVRQRDGVYEYPELDSICTQTDYDAWTAAPGTYFHWTMTIYSKFTVRRDRVWWEANVDCLERFWSTLESFRLKPRAEQEELLKDPPRRVAGAVSTNKKPVITDTPASFDFVAD
jgi:putative phage-type endonuclease